MIQKALNIKLIFDFQVRSIQNFRIRIAVIPGAFHIERKTFKDIIFKSAEIAVTSDDPSWDNVTGSAVSLGGFRNINNQSILHDC